MLLGVAIVALPIIIGEKDMQNNTMAVNIFGQDNAKDVDYKEAIKIINNTLKEPEFSLNGWRNRNW